MASFNLDQMKPQELINIIKSTYLKFKEENSKINLDSDSSQNISLESDKFPVLDNHLELKKWLIKIFKNHHEVFIQDIEWVSPNPLTFRIVLINDEFFYMIRTERTWIAKVEGKKYYLINTNEFDICCQSISRLLEYASTQNKDIKDEEGDENTESEEPTPEEETPSEEI